MTLDRIRQILVVLLALSQFITPFLFRNDFDNTPSETPLYLLPAGYAFIVWLVIWILCASYATYQLRPDQLERSLHQDIGWHLIIIMTLFNIWLWAQQSAVTTATGGLQNPIWLIVTQLILTGMLITAVVAFSEIRSFKDQLQSLDLWLVQVPFAVYFAWLTAAYSTGIATYFYESGWVGTQLGVPLTVGILIVVGIITSTVIWQFNTTHGAVAYSTVIIWAVVSIAVQNLNQSQIVVIAALVIAIAVLVATMYTVNNRIDGDPPTLITALR
ncbi:MAG: hypothetical protein AAF846_00495 [Chloroflexota bacterium]